MDLVPRVIYGFGLMLFIDSNVALKDSTGATSYTDIVTVQASSDSSCVSSSSIVISPGTSAGSPTSTSNSGNSSPASGGSGT